jgi:Tol biopolymer transport system component
MGGAYPSTSAKGRFVAFVSRGEILVRDRQAGTIERATVAIDGGQANARSQDAAISANGRFVGFSSEATNLVAGDTNGAWDAFVRDRQLGATIRVSVGSGGIQAAGGGASPSLSVDGRFVAFTSSAEDLVAGDTNGVSDVFVHDRRNNVTRRVGMSSAGAEANAFTDSATISANGRFVVFTSAASNLVSGDTNGKPDIFVRDLERGTTRRVNVSNRGRQDNGLGIVDTATISGNGRLVAFTSSGSGLVAGDTNERRDVFVHDNVTKSTTRVNFAFDGRQADGESVGAGISGGGRFVTFSSDSVNLVARDSNEEPDVFVTDRRAVCRVPMVIGLQVAVARRLIRAAGCSVGLLQRKRDRRNGRVLAQSPRAGATRPFGARVDLVVGRHS